MHVLSITNLLANLTRWAFIKVEHCQAKNQYCKLKNNVKMKQRDSSNLKADFETTRNLWLLNFVLGTVTWSFNCEGPPNPPKGLATCVDV